MYPRRNVIKFAALGATPIGLSMAACRDPANAASPSGRVSVLDFIDSAHHSSILDGSLRTDISARIQAAVDSGENLYFPGSGSSRYLIDGQIRLSSNYQRLFSDGLVRLDFHGVDPRVNAIELLSLRRDSGNTGSVRKAQSLSGFRITGPASAQYASMIFVEEGTFFPSIERIYSEAGANHGYLGRLSQAYIRVNGNERSYVNDIIIRDCAISGVRAGRCGFPPVGIWVEGAIEGRIENTKVFYFDECMRLGDTGGRIRNLQHMVFDQVQLEPTKPGEVVDDQCALNIYSASACTFRDCRFTPGNGPGSANSVAVRISPGGFGAQQIRFRDCSFQGMRHARDICHVLPGAVAEDVVFSGGDIRGFTGQLLKDDSGRARIRFGGDVFADR